VALVVQRVKVTALRVVILFSQLARLRAAALEVLRK